MKDEQILRVNRQKKCNDRGHLTKPRVPYGKYPEMECHLADNIRYMRMLGMPVESWMLRLEGRLILHKLYPNEIQAPMFDDREDEDSFPFKFSNTWKRDFLSRHNFSFQKLGSRTNNLGITQQHIETISDYHLNMRALKLSEIRDPVWGYTSPYYVFTHDQFPLELAAKNEKTIDNKGEDEIYDASTKDADVKRFCTLNLFGAMDYREDMLNVPPVHLVFRASKFRTGDEWHDEDERKQWDSRVVVSFQPNAWVGEETHKYGLKKVLGPINDLLKQEGTDMRGVTIEDNLSVHHTSGTEQFWKEELKHFDMARFVPANMTEIVQAIDRHIGVRYKEAVYTSYRKRCGSA